jgi:fermentation-respiration switch protein FrsA (DUF1100 family)
MLRRFLLWTLTAVFGVGGRALLLRALETSLIYFPSREYAGLPRDLGLRSEDLRLEARGGARLEGWWIRGEGRRALLFFHGNAGNISHRLERARLLVESLGLDVVLVDYRGYGRSTGKPDEEGLYADGEAIYDAVAARGFGPDRIVLFGESLGCAVAIETAVRRRSAAVVLETPFLSVPEMAKAIYPFLPRFLVRTRFDNEAKIRGLRVPKLIVAAERDDVVPPEHARRLFDAAAPPREMFVIPGATHNDTYVAGGKEYLGVLRKFLEFSGGGS